MINNVVLVGNLTKDPDLRYTQSGTAVATFTLAVSRNFKNDNGERETDFINCVMWRKPAENFANFAHKGSRIGIQGRIQTRHYDNQQGQRVYVTEIVADTFALLDAKKEGQSGSSGLNKGNGHPHSKTPSQPKNDPFASAGDLYDSADLPF